MVIDRTHDAIAFWLHRDIKPENILLESGHAVVADFGIARAISAAGGDRLTETLDFRKLQLKRLDDEVGHIERSLDRLSGRISKTTGENWDSSFPTWRHEDYGKPSSSELDTFVIMDRIQRVSARLFSLSGELDAVLGDAAELEEE